MTNKEKYKQVFSTLRLPEDISLEVEKMEKTKKQRKFKQFAAAAVGVLVIGSGTTAYAANVGGIQRILQLWIHGEQTEVTLQFDGNGGYTGAYTDSEGNSQDIGGGGVAVGADGTARPVTEEELMEQLNQPEVEYGEDGSVWVYWMDQKADITDEFKNDVCYIKLEDQGKTLYMTVKYKNGYSISSNKYTNPSSFN